jgi:hypothetical protein
MPIYIWAWQMESGTVQLNATGSHSDWVNVTLQQTYATPPLIFSIATGDGGDPCTVRIQNVTNSSFDILQVEPPNQDGPHMQMTIHYLAIDSGVHFLPDGTKIVAGKISTTAQQGYKNVDVTKSWESISFGEEFEDTPIVLGMIQTLNNEVNDIPSEPSTPFLTTVIKSVKTDGFSLALERSEVNASDVNNSEIIAYMAISNEKNGTIPTNGGSVLYETASKNDVQGWSNGCYSYDFVNTYSDAPNVVSTKQTRNGDNGGWFRRCSLDENSTGLTIDEDKYNDGERSHIKETAGIVVFEKDFAFDSKLLNPTVEYRMDECYWLGSGAYDVYDSSPNGANGEALNGAQITKNDAIINNAGSFDGSDDHISIDDDGVLDFNQTFTLTMWLKPKSTNTDVIIEKYTDARFDRDKKGWRLYYDRDLGNDDLIFQIKIDGNIKEVKISDLGNKTNWTDEWHFISVMYDGDSLKLIFDDLNDTEAVSGSIENSSSIL